MIYVFEDSVHDTLSQAVVEYLRSEHSNLLAVDQEFTDSEGVVHTTLASETVIYAASNSNLSRVLLRLLDLGVEDSVRVYMDVVPDSRYTMQEFHNVRRVCAQFVDARVLPIPCIEYLALCSILPLSTGLTHLAADRSVHLYDPALSKCRKGEELQRVEVTKSELTIARKNFEKYCKFVLRYRFIPCVSPDNRNPQNYWRTGCKCVKVTCDVPTLDLSDKFLRMVKLFPGFEYFKAMCPMPEEVYRKVYEKCYREYETQRRKYIRYYCKKGYSASDIIARCKSLPYFF